MPQDTHPPARAEILREAEKLITGDRDVSYGSPAENFENIAQIWTTLLRPILKDDAQIDTRHVADLMIALKLARNMSGEPKRDTYVDIAGYAACGYEAGLPPKPKKEESTPAERSIQITSGKLANCARTYVV